MQNKGGKIINPNHPQQNPENFAHLEPSSVAAPPKSRTSPEEPRDGEFRQLSTSSSRNESNYGSERSTHQPQPQQPWPKVMGRVYESPVRRSSEQGGAAALPRFGEWDENDLQSAENVTFSMRPGSGRCTTEASFIPNIPYGRGGSKSSSKEPKKRGCFFWW